jgi:hypothetical protein
MTHRAVIAAVNDYTGQTSLPPGWVVPNLGKCLADAYAVRDLLTTSFGATVTCLTDGDASRDAILAAINDMVTASQAGDTATFFFAGHGAQMPADPANPQRYYECFIPASGAPITDLDLHGVADQLEPSYVNFTLLLDSCFSGGIHEGTPDAVVRSINFPSDFIDECVASLTSIIPCGVLIPRGSSDLDGNVSQVVGQGNGIVCSVDDDKALVASSKTCVVAACRYDETDAELSDHGALTKALLAVVADRGTSLSYLDMIDALRDEISNTLNLTQTPTLLGQQNRMGEMFLAGWNQSKPGEFDPGSGPQDVPQSSTAADNATDDTADPTSANPDGSSDS